LRFKKKNTCTSAEMSMCLAGEIFVSNEHSFHSWFSFL